MPSQNNKQQGKKMNPKAPKLLPQSNDKNFYQINEIVNSIFAMNAQAIDSQLYNLSKIVGQFLRNDLITHINSVKALKLLAYELVMTIAQESVSEKPRLTFLENAFEENKKIRFSASLKNNLTSIGDLLDNLMWNSEIGKKRSSNSMQEDQDLQEKYEQFQFLLKEFKRYFDEDDEDKEAPYHSAKKHKAANQQLRKLKKNQKDHEQELEENEALIEQLEEIVSKKQKRIKQLTGELEESIIEQKQLEDLIDELQERNFNLSQEIMVLNEKLAQKDSTELSMKETIDEMQGKLLLQEKKFSSVKKINHWGQNHLKGRLSIDELQEDRKQFKDLFELSSLNKTCEQCSKKKDRQEQSEGIKKMLLTQALSIQAMI